MKKKFAFLILFLLCFISFDVKASKASDAEAGRYSDSLSKTIINAQGAVPNEETTNSIGKKEDKGFYYDNSIIPADYSFPFGGTGKMLDVKLSFKNPDCTTSYGDGPCNFKYIGREFKDYFLIANDSIKGTSACYSNVGTYNGKSVDVKGELIDFDINKSHGEGLFAFFSRHGDKNEAGNTRPGIYAIGLVYVKVKWSFYEYNKKKPCEGSAINGFKGHTTYSDVDNRQGIILHDGHPGSGKRLYVKKSNSDYLFISRLKDIGPYIFSSANDESANGKAFTEIFYTGKKNNSITRTYTFIRTPGKKDNNTNWWGSGGIAHYGNKPQAKIETPYDYSVDAACNNCDSKTDKSMVIQDTTNWTAITSSTAVAEGICDNDELKNYYSKGNGVYCREEYRIRFPNESNRIKIFEGRFFTLNAEQNELNAIDNEITNYRPITVTKIRQCKGGDLNKFRNSSDNSFSTCGGSIKINYNEKTYKYNDELKYTRKSFTSVISGGMLEQRAEFSYTLKDNIYRYIRISDGFSQKNKPTDSNDRRIYKDALISNLPISFNSKGASISFEYSLPNKSGTTCSDANSKLYSAYYDSGNDYLKCKNFTTNNVYAKGDTSSEKLSDSACAKLYVINSSSFISCRDARKTNKIGTCLSNNYTCSLRTCNEQTAGKDEYKDMKWNSVLKKCEKNGTGTDCNLLNYKELGRSWNETTEECCSPGTTYNSNTGKCEPPGGTCSDCEEGYTCNPETKRCDPDPEGKCELLECIKNDRPCCKDEEGNIYCGYKINNQDVCPGKSFGFIYRVIDRNMPFVAQQGSIRNTGDNWCSNSLAGESAFTCSGRGSENMVVKAAISDKANISEDEAMYVVDLDADRITSIRDYNRTHDYDDFNLNCKSDGSACISKFLRSYVLNGSCQNDTQGNFYTCGR